MSSKKDFNETRSFLHVFLLVHDFRQIPKRIAIVVWVGISAGALIKVIGSLKQKWLVPLFHWAY